MKKRNIQLISPLPIPPKDLPKIKIDYNGLLLYAKNKGVKVIDLTEKEKSRFIIKL